MSGAPGPAETADGWGLGRLDNPPPPGENGGGAAAPETRDPSASRAQESARAGQEGGLRRSRPPPPGERGGERGDPSAFPSQPRAASGLQLG